MYKWQQVKALRANGESIKKIARTLKLSRNTVRKYLRNQEPLEFKKRNYEKMLDQYEDEIEAMVRKRYIGTRIYFELIELGYEGSLSTIHRQIREMKKEDKLKKQITTRVETEPGQQMQYDWKEWALPVDGRLLKIYIHELVLGYSRKKYYTYSLCITTAEVIRAMQEGIHFFKGIAPELVIDNAKQMVITDERDGIVRYNDEFLKFCGLYGIDPSPCQNYRPRTKGKAERPFFYIQEHLLRGLQVKELSEFDRKLEDFMDKYNDREHSSLKESPENLYLREKDHLRKIPKVEPTMLLNRPFREVSNDGYIAYNGGFYPVPMSLSLQSVRIEPVLGKLLRVYDEKGQLVVEHPVNLWETAVKPQHPEHEEINKSYRDNKEARRSEVVRKFIETFNGNAILYIEGLKGSAGVNLYWHLGEIMKYTDIYPAEDVREVLSECIEIGAYHKNSVKHLLSLRQIEKPISAVITPPKILRNVNLRRDLSVYKVQEVSYE